MATANLAYADAKQTGTDIEEKSVIGPPPGSPPETISPTITVDASASLLIEYVAALDTSYRPWMSSRYVQALPNPIDDIMTDFGSRVYDRDMMHDPQVYSTLSVLVMALLSQGIRLSSPLEDTDTDYEASLNALRFCNSLHDNLAHNPTEIMFELAEGMLKMGHKVGEQIYARGDWEGTQYTLLRDIKTKPHEATAFVVDPFNNELGLIFVQPGQPLPRLTGIGGSIVGTPSVNIGTSDPTKQPKVIPRSKFIIPANRRRNGDPRGISHLRSVYTPWWKKQQMNPQHLAFVTRFAQPSIYANLPATAKDVTTPGPGGAPIRRSIVRATNDALASLKGGAVASFVDTTVEMLETKLEGGVIFASYEHEDRQIAKGILMQTLTTEEAQHMSRASGSQHQDVFGLLIAYLRFVLECCWRNEVLRPSLKYNFGDDASTNLCPTVSLGDTAVQDIPSLMSAIAQMLLAQGIHWSQLPKIWAMLGLPAANIKEWEADMKLAQTTAKANADQARATAKAAIIAPNQPAGKPPTPRQPAPTTPGKPPPSHRPNVPSTAPKGGK